MSKFNLSIIPKKFNKKVSVADIKQYLVDEFNTNKNLQNDVYKLQDELKIAKEYEVKYTLSLTTLDEYKRRMENTQKRNKELETQIKTFQDKIKEKTYEINDLKLENKKMEKYVNDIKKNVRKEVINEFKEKVIQLKGHIKKDDLLKIFK